MHFALQPATATAMMRRLERWDANSLPTTRWNRRFLPHYFNKPTARFHHELAEHLAGMHTRRGSRISYIAPRGGAKSTWVTLAYALRCALEGWEQHILILSDSSDQADQHLRHLRKELEDNPKIDSVYDNVSGSGPEWKGSRIQLRNGVIVEALGTGKKVRGRRNRASRPSLIIFDDIQSNEDVVSPVIRERAWRWATAEVIPAGDENTNFLAVGSAIHREAVSVKLGHLAGWKAHTYRAIISWPDRMDMWLEFERLATNLADPEREATARAFYAANKSAMDSGGVVYWPERWPLVDMMLVRATIGHNAFESEYQGVPGTLDGAEWPPEYFDREGLWFDDWPDCYLKVCSLDPSKGSSSNAGDYQAHIQAGLARDGVIYVEAHLLREPVMQMVSRAVDLLHSWKPDEYVLENNDGLGMVVDAFQRECLHRKYAFTPKAVMQTTNKETRIRTRLDARLARAGIRFRNTHGTRLLVDQLRDFPRGDHDDGPDALELAIRRLAELTGVG